MNTTDRLEAAAQHLEEMESLPDDDLERLRIELTADVGQLLREYRDRHVDSGDDDTVDTEDVGKLYDDE